MTAGALVRLATLGSLALLAGAWAFQHLGGLAPCSLCLWQRWPHAVAVLMGTLALMLPGVVWPLLGALAVGASAVLGAYHTGVERGWWEGPTTCSAGPIGGLSTDELFDQIMNAPLVRCDEVPWEMFGLSMASWNMVISLVLMALWIAAARKPA